jgi:hypothetical protein
MVLILSNENDPITGDIANCLLFKDGISSLILNEFSINCPGQLKIKLNNSTKCSIEIEHNEISYIFKRKMPLLRLPVSRRHQLASFYQSEFEAMISFFDLLVINEYSGLGAVNYNPNDVNKLFVLKTALDVGLRIPNTTVVNKRVDYIKFIEREEGSCITKPIQNIAAFYDRKSKSISKMLTARVNGTEVIGDSFFPTLLQNEIKKELEIRAFFICEEIYSVAIFSQSNKKTEIDYRNYDDVNPNRIMVYSLPDDIKGKISELMNRLNLSTGSIDFILSDTNEYIFLEVNPFGLFGQFTNAGFDIAKIIANKIKVKLYENKKRTTFGSV